MERSEPAANPQTHQGPSHQQPAPSATTAAADSGVRRQPVATPSNPRTTTERGRSPLAAVLAALALGLILGGAATAFYLQASDDGGDPFAGQVDPARYQAVILSNDKVYFGRIDSVSDDFFRLRTAFFLRETAGTADTEPVRALLPVNREIHAPDNTLLIRKADVILVENLAKDSPILTEIRRQVGNAK